MNTAQGGKIINGKLEIINTGCGEFVFFAIPVGGLFKELLGKTQVGASFAVKISPGIQSGGQLLKIQQIFYDCGVAPFNFDKGPFPL